MVNFFFSVLSGIAATVMLIVGPFQAEIPWAWYVLSFMCAWTCQLFANQRLDRGILLYFSCLVIGAGSIHVAHEFQMGPVLMLLGMCWTAAAYYGVRVIVQAKRIHRSDSRAIPVPQ